MSKKPIVMQASTAMERVLDEAARRAMGGEDVTLRKEIERAINKHSAENGSDTPDWILAAFLMSCLYAFDGATNERERWYGRKLDPVPPEQEPKP